MKLFGLTILSVCVAMTQLSAAPLLDYNSDKVIKIAWIAPEKIDGYSVDAIATELTRQLKRDAAEVSVEIFTNSCRTLMGWAYANETFAIREKVLKGPTYDAIILSENQTGMATNPSIYFEGVAAIHAQMNKKLRSPIVTYEQTPVYRMRGLLDNQLFHLTCRIVAGNHCEIAPVALSRQQAYHDNTFDKFERTPAIEEYIYASVLYTVLSGGAMPDVFAGATLADDSDKTKLIRSILRGYRMRTKVIEVAKMAPIYQFTNFNKNVCRATLYDGKAERDLEPYLQTVARADVRKLIIDYSKTGPSEKSDSFTTRIGTDEKPENTAGKPVFYYARNAFNDTFGTNELDYVERVFELAKSKNLIPVNLATARLTQTSQIPIFNPGGTEKHILAMRAAMFYFAWTGSLVIPSEWDALSQRCAMVGLGMMLESKNLSVDANAIICRPNFSIPGKPYFSFRLWKKPQSLVRVYVSSSDPLKVETKVDSLDFTTANYAVDQQTFIDTTGRKEPLRFMWACHEEDFLGIRCGERIVVE